MMANELRPRGPTGAARQDELAGRAGASTSDPKPPVPEVPPPGNPPPEIPKGDPPAERQESPPEIDPARPGPEIPFQDPPQREETPAEI